MIKILLLTCSLFSAIGAWALDLDSLEQRIDSEFIARNVYLPEIIKSLESEKFSLSYSKKDIPKDLKKIETYFSPDILKEMKLDPEWNNDNELTPVSFANPNQLYNCCCEPTPGLPYRKIVAILKNKKHTIISYLRGAGPTTLSMLLWAETDKVGKVTKMWVGQITNPDIIANNKANILNMFKKNYVEIPCWEY